MFRRSLFSLMSFDTLLCGVLSLSDKFPHKEAGKDLSQYRCWSEKALIPTPLAISITSGFLKRKDFSSLICVLAPHPEKDTVIRVVCEMLCNEHSCMQIRDWEELLKVLQYINVSPKSIAIASQFACQNIRGIQKTEFKREAKGTNVEDVESLHLWITRFTRYHPFVAPLTLSSLCLLSHLLKTSGAERVEEDLLDVALCALRYGSISPQDCGRVITLIDQPRRVLTLWRWMQYTSAKWNQRAASAAVIALARHKRFADAVGTLQTLAVVATHPTIPAQVAFLDLLSRTTPPLPEYGNQLVQYWHPHQEKRWGAAVIDVTVAQMFVHFRCGNYDQCLDILSSAADGVLSDSFSEKSRKMAIVQLAKNRKMFHVAHYFFDEISSSRTLLRFLFEEPLKMIDEFYSSPSAISIILGISRRLKDESRKLALEKLGSIKHLIDDTSFEKIVRDVAEDSCGQSSQETLDLVNAIGSVLEKEVPSQIVAWIKLA